MPPEPLPWDRKDLFKERKHERSESFGSVARWRESSSHHGGSRGFTRWGSGDLRRPPGHVKHGSWHVFPDESGHGYAPSRPTDKLSDDDNNRRPVFRGEGKYNRSSRESKESLGQRDWKGTHACETTNGSLHTPGRPTDTNNSQRSLDMIIYASPTHSEPGNTWNCRQPHSKEEKHDKVDDLNAFRTAQKFDGENSLGSLDWKPLKWSRSGSLSSRGSGLSHSSSSKSMGGVDSNEANGGTLTINVATLESPTRDAALYGTTANTIEDMASRKKPRLRWGEGLAKYEKKKIEGPEESASKSGAEPTQSLGLSGTEKSPRFVSFSDCASPATPSSVACSSSPGLEEKSFGKAMNVDSEVNNLCESVHPGSHNQLEGLLFNLENLDLNSLGTLGYSLSELLQSDDANSVDSSFARTTAVSKLLLLKGEVLKTIEVTESEIDSLENELKGLTSVARSSCACTASSSSMPVETRGNYCDGGQDYVSSSILRLAPLQITSSGDIGEGEVPLPNSQLKELHANDKDDDVDSPGTATSKFVEPITRVKSSPSADLVYQCQSPVNFDVSCAVKTEINQSARDAPHNRLDLIACSDNAMVNDINTSRENMLCQLIFSSNKESAKEASDAFTPLLPTSHSNHDTARVNDNACHESILEKFTKRKRLAKFKESVTTLQFRALHHLWKEDLRLLSLRKSRAKSHKKFEPSLRISVNGYQKHRSSARSRFSPPVGNLRLVPTKEMLAYTSQLLSDSKTRQFRESLKMPALILDEREKTANRFLSTNGLVEDPCGFEKERTLINPWMVEEQQIFLDKFATFGKDFTKIASFLDHKTTADCVQFYYKNHKSDIFQKTKKKHEFGKNGKPASASTYLVASRKKWNRGISTVSLDVLGDASLLASQADGSMLEEQVFSRRFSMGGVCSNYSKTKRRDSSILDRMNTSYSNLETERETAAADVLAGICGSFSSEAMGSCVTSSLDHGEGHQAVTKEPLTPDVAENLEDETYSGESCGEMEDPPDWTDEEKAAFIEAVSSYGKDFAMISRHVRSRSVSQCKVFYSKARKCLGLDAVQPSNGCVGSPDSDDTDGRDDSDADEEDAFVSKMDEDLPCTAEKANNGSCEPLKFMDLETDGSGEEGTVRIGDLVDMQPKEDGLESICGRNDDPFSSTEAVRRCKESAASLVKVEEGAVTNRDSRESCSVYAAVPDGWFCKGVDEKREADEKQQQQRVEECSTSSTSYTAAAADTPTTGFSLNGNLEPKEEQLCLRLEAGPGTDRSCLLQHQRARSLPPDAASDWVMKSNVRDRFSSAVGQDDEGCSNRRHLSGVAAASFSSEMLMLRGSPVEAMHKEEIRGGSDRSREVTHQSWLSKHSSEAISFNSSHSLYMPQQQEQDLYLLQKCSNGSITRHTDNGPSVTHVKLKHSSSSADTERHPKKSVGGDFKLFGQKILSSTPHHQKDDKGVGLNRSTSSLVTATVMKPNNHLVHHVTATGSSSHTMDGGPAAPAAASPVNFERTVTTMTTTSTSGGSGVGSRNYGFWDGNKIQATGFSSSLPDSALLLAKYPAAFSNYRPVPLTTATTAKTGISNEYDNNLLNGVASASAALFPSTPTSSSSVNGVHMYRNFDGLVKPFTLEVKQQSAAGASAGLYHHTEMPRCNGLDALSSSLQQLVGRGGPCNVVSDPVAAIKMHYAQTELQQQGQTGTKGIIMREDETTSWRDR